MPVKSPLDIADPTLRLTIKANGQTIKDYYPVIGIQIHQEINRISSAEIILIDGTDGTQGLPISDSDDFVPGNEIVILAGYGNEEQKSIFKGIIVKQAISLHAESGFNLIVSCKHKAVRMTINRKDEEFNKVTDSNIISGIIDNYGLSSEVDNTSSQQDIVFQKLATDWDFILARAGFYGYVTILEEDKVIIGKPTLDGSPLLRLTAGESIISFNAEMNAEKQSSSLDASAWDPDSQQLLNSQATEPTINEQGNMGAKKLSGTLNQTKLSLSSITPMVKDDLKTWADGKLLMMRLNALKGQVSFIGNADVKVGGLIELENVGERFNGKAYVSSITHTIERGAWTTKVKFGLDYKPIFEQTDFSYPDATGQLPAIKGLQIATVQKVFDDAQEAKNKILILLSSNAENKNGIWARVSNFYATSGAGAFFLPEVGDEILVGFLESDPRYPVVLGSLYSNSRKPAIEAADNNNYIKSLTTRSKLKVAFDDENKILSIETPEGNQITFNDKDKLIEIKDQNSNLLKMTSDGINMQSEKDITIKASGNITLEATGKMNLSAKQDASLSGMNVSNEAKSAFTAKGNSKAEISASGQTVVKGGLVMIN